ncbi:uncharacterized protein LOC116852097 isoform X2 [Odontomachus brunneus]|uniref:uncharacterized protein LOC116852097 isoform X2 n=1 Tax=Odontomachus brunneus TaxID=486640 RepID=UPI0013F232B5|nr:uncharacterized protein LOC116852097 isoform X2 [Odontomachus brunneus]
MSGECLRYSREYTICEMEEAAADYSLQSGIDNDRPNEKNSNLMSHNDGIHIVEQVTQFTCSLYISRADGLQDQGHIVQGCELLRSKLEEVIAAVEPFSAWRVTETPCGLIAAFARENDAEKLLQRGDLGQVFGTPVQVARFSARDSRYRQAVLLRGVPWTIPLEDINSALAKQGIVVGNIERARQFVRVEVIAHLPSVSLNSATVGAQCAAQAAYTYKKKKKSFFLFDRLLFFLAQVFDAGHYEALLRQGLNFFGATRFNGVPERWWRGGNSPGCSSMPSQCAPRQNDNTSATSNVRVVDGVLQCYRCQGFWHVAANCRHLPRCVRCGEPHSVEFCPRPRNNPICCHCSGPHHAGYRQCPVRLQLSNATPVSITLSTTHIGGQYPASAVNKSNPSCHSLRQGHY